MKRAHNPDKASTLRQEIKALRSEQELLATKIEKLSQELETLDLETKRPKDFQRAEEAKVTLEQCRSKIGQKVRIINTKPGEPNVGKIHRVGKLYITVKLPDQTLKRRVADNLRLIHHDRKRDRN